MPNSASSPAPASGTLYTVTIPADLTPAEQARFDATGKRPVRVAVPETATADTAIEMARQLAAMQRTSPAAVPAVVTPASGTLFDALAVELLNGLVRAGQQNPDLADRMGSLLGAGAVSRPAADEDPLLTVEEFGEFTGYAPKTIRKFTREGMPHVGRHRGMRIRQRAGVAWLEAREKSSDAADPIERLADQRAETAKKRGKR